MSDPDTPTRPLISAAISPEIDLSPSDLEKALHEIAHQDQSIQIALDLVWQRPFVRVLDESQLKRLRDLLRRD